MPITPPTAETIAGILARLDDNGQDLAELTNHLSEARAQQPLTPGEWSAHQVVAHLHGCLTAWGGDLTRILAEPGTSWRRPHPYRFMEGLLAEHPTFAASVEAYTRDRDDLVSTLWALSLGQWGLEAIIRGTPHQVMFEASAVARHERTHIRHLLRTTGDARPGSH